MLYFNQLDCTQKFEIGNLLIVSFNKLHNSGTHSKIAVISPYPQPFYGSWPPLNFFNGSRISVNI